MKKYILAFLVCLLSCVTFAQTENKYVVYSNSGVSTLRNGKQQIQIKNGITLTDNSIVTIPEGGRLVIINEETRQRYTITKAGSNAIGNLIKTSRKKTLIEAELKYLRKQLAGHTTEGKYDNYLTIDRKSDVDSLLTDTVAK